jgi:hypothetical protein
VAKQQAVTLMQRTQQLLRDTDKTYNMILIDLGIPQNWLSLFANDRLPDPSVNRVQKLYEYLSGKTLVV